MEKENLQKIFETPYERKLREYLEMLVEDYLSYKDLIMSKQVKPNRIMNFLAEKYGRNYNSIRVALKRCGVYVDKDNPCVVNNHNDMNMNSIAK